MTFKEKNRKIEGLLSDVEVVIEKLENQLNRQTGKYENEKVTDIINQLLKAYSIKASILLSNNVSFFTNS